MATAVWATEAVAITALRSQGGQSTSLKALSALDGAEALNAAVRAINVLRPLYQFGYFATVADTYAYATSGAASGSPPVERIHPLRVFWPKDGQYVYGTDEIDDGDRIGDGTQMGFVHRKLLAALRATDTVTLGQDEMEAAWEAHDALTERLGGIGYELGDRSSVHLRPTPTTAVRAYWIAQIARFATIAAVTLDYERPVMLYAEAKACAIIAGKQSEGGRIEFAPGHSITTAAGKVYEARSRQAMAEFEALVPAPSGVAGTM